MKTRQYATDRIPFISDVRSYHGLWMVWWSSCQPAWRRDKGWPLPRDTDSANTTDWGKVGARGQSGMFLVVMSTTWWASSIDSEEEQALFDEAMDDIHWVINQVVGRFNTIQTPIPPPKPSNKTPPLQANWMTRADGKRQSRPSRRMLEAHGA